MSNKGFRRGYPKKPKGLKEITDEEFKVKLKRHQKWVITRGKVGEKEDFTGYDFEDRDFTRAILSEADFRGSWLQDTNFNKATLKKCNFEDCWVGGSYSAKAIWAGANIKGTLWAEK